jgi:hypothetical protein
VPSRCRLPLSDDLLDTTSDALQRDPQRLQGIGRDALALVDEAKEDVLGADVVVVQHPSFLLGQDDDPARPVGEPFEHGPQD